MLDLPINIEEGMVTIAMPLWAKLGMPSSIPVDETPNAWTFRAICHLFGWGGCVMDERKARRLFLKAEAAGSAQAYAAHGKWLNFSSLIAMNRKGMEEAIGLLYEAFRLGETDGYLTMAIGLSMATGHLDVPGAPKFNIEDLISEHGHSDDEVVWRAASGMVVFDPKKGREWMQKALDSGSIQAYYDIAKFLDDDGLEEAAVDMMKLGMERGNDSCAGWLAGRLFNSSDAPKNLDLLYSYTDRARRTMIAPYLGYHGYALFGMGGTGKTVDFDEVIRCLTMASVVDLPERELYRDFLSSLTDHPAFAESRQDGSSGVSLHFIAHWLFSQVSKCRHSAPFITYAEMWKRMAFMPGMCRPYVAA